MATMFTEVYNRFLGKITDDMYMEITPEETIKDLRQLLIDAIPGFEFPRQNIDDYVVETLVVREDQVKSDDFVIGVVWDSTEEHEGDDIPDMYIERSSFNCDLTSEEINILAILMMQTWVQRQLTSIENTRMKYSSTTFKMTSQANHMSKMQSLLENVREQSLHYQRLYRRRRRNDNGQIVSNWDSFGHGIYGEYRNKD